MESKDEEVVKEVARLVEEVDPPPPQLEKTVKTLLENEVILKGWRLK